MNNIAIQYRQLRRERDLLKDRLKGIESKMSRYARGRAEFVSLDEAAEAAKKKAIEMLIDNVRANSRALSTCFEVVVLVKGGLYLITVVLKITSHIDDKIVAEVAACEWEVL